MSLVAMSFLGAAAIAAAGAADAAATDDVQELKKVIEAQQLQLDAQSQLLQELLRRVEKLTEDTGQGPASAAAPSAPQIAQATAADGDPPDVEPDWPGSFRLFDSETRLAVGGFVQLDLIHDTDAIGAPCQFISGTIPTDGGTPAQGSEGQTNFCVNTSRLTFASRTPTLQGRLATFLSLDLFGDALSMSPSPRLRQAYGELEGALWGGDLLLGQSWGTYVDLDAWPDILDFEGPGSAIAVRQPMVRWSKGAGDVGFQVALEEPGGGSVAGADALRRWPDLVVTVKRSHGGGHLRGAGIVRDVRTGTGRGVTASATGWGISGSGKVMLSADTDLFFETSYGEGVGAYYNDGPPVGIYDPTSSDLELLPLFAYYAGFRHGWSDTLSSTVLYAALDVDNLDFQPDDVGKKSAYSSLNLIWRPDEPLMFGLEFLRGGRRDKGGAEGTVNRIQFTSRFSF